LKIIDLFIAFVESDKKKLIEHDRDLLDVLGIESYLCWNNFKFPEKKLEEKLKKVGLINGR